jgi:hypothetical protein
MQARGSTAQLTQAEMRTGVWHGAQGWEVGHTATAVGARAAMAGRACRDGDYMAHGSARARSGAARGWEWPDAWAHAVAAHE